MVNIYIGALHHDKPQSPEVTGIHFTVDYMGGQAQISILDMQPLPDPTQLDAFRDELRRLGEALLVAAQSPQLIFWHPHPEQK